MKVYRPLAEAIVHNLMLIFNLNQKADEVIQKSLLSNKKWGSRDRNFIAEHTYDIIRWWRLIKFCAEIDQRKITEESTYWKMLGAHLLLKSYELPDWAEFAGLEANKVLTKKEEANAVTKIRESIPDWLMEIGEAEVPDWETELHALNEPSKVFIRHNTLKSSNIEFEAMCIAEDLEIEALEEVPNAYVLVNRKNLKNLDVYRKGHLEIQDSGSQLIGHFAEVEPGMTVIDACAGAGGKSLLMAALMNNKGSITAMDVETKKLDELKRRAQRMATNIIHTQKITSSELKANFDKADRLVLDVPCSGTGVLKRNPDTKWKLKSEFLEKIKGTQAQILADYAPMCKIGGKLIYATCSLLKSENEEQVSNFLQAHPNFDLETERRVSPAATGFDGFYMARLLRKY